MNAIKTIGLSASLLLATGFANASDYELGDITDSYNDGFYYVNSFVYLPSDPFIDTFTFSIAEESRLSALASVWTDFDGYDFDGYAVIFSSIQLEGFEGEVMQFYDSGVGAVFGGMGSEAELNDVTLAAGSYSLQIEGALLDYYMNIEGSKSYEFYITASSIAAPVPEPSSIALVLGGLGLVGFMAARRKRT